MSPIQDLYVLGIAKGIIGITERMPQPRPESISGTAHARGELQQQQQQGSRYSAEHIRQQQAQQQGQ